MAISKAPTTDFTSTTLNGTIDDSTTTITVASGTNIQVPCYIVVDREDGNGGATPTAREVMKVTAKSTDDLTVERGANNSTARSHNSGALVEPMITVGFWADTYTALDAEHDMATGAHEGALVTTLKATGAVVTTGTSDVTIVTPKALTDSGYKQNPMTTQGDVIYGGTSGVPTRLAKGTAAQVLTMNTGETAPEWAASAAASADGWTAAGTFTYASATTITVASGAASIYNVGDRLKLTDSTVKYFIVTVVADTLLTVYGGTDYTLSGGAITLPYYSHHKSPLGFPPNPTKWQVRVASAALRETSTPTQNTWYNAESIAIPIGEWRVHYDAILEASDASVTFAIVYGTLSTANNSETDGSMTTVVAVNGASGTIKPYNAQHREKYLTLAAAATYYLNYKTDQASVDTIYVRGDLGSTVLEATCAYL